MPAADLRHSARAPGLTRSQARRIALRAQNLEREVSAGRGSVARAAIGLGVLQLDSVNVLERAHYLPLYSRLGAYPRHELDALFNHPPRRLLEQWGHEACLVSPEVHRLLAPVRRRWAEQHADSIEARYPGVVDRIHQVIEAHGPLTGREVQLHLADDYPAQKPAKPGWWTPSATKAGLESAFHGGTIASAGRNASFERRYDLVERIVPAQHLPEPELAAALRELTRRSLRHVGIGTVTTVADFYRLKNGEVLPILEEMERTGEAERVTVAGQKGDYWKDASARVPRAVNAQTLLSPFDPLIFERRRTEELFGMRYRIGIYTPAAQRQTGYYSLPLLMGEHITARYDLKADRKAGTLIVNGTYLEPAHDEEWPSETEIAAAAAAELGRLAGWLGLAEDPSFAGPTVQLRG